MALHSLPTFADRLAHWVLKQSWLVLGLLGALLVGTSVAVGSMAPANLIGTSLLGGSVAERINLSEAAIPLPAPAGRGLSGVLGANFAGGWGDDSGPETPSPVPSSSPNASPTPTCPNPCPEGENHYCNDSTGFKCLPKAACPVACDLATCKPKDTHFPAASCADAGQQVLDAMAAAAQQCSECTPPDDGAPAGGDDGSAAGNDDPSDQERCEQECRDQDKGRGEYANGQCRCVPDTAPMTCSRCEQDQCVEVDPVSGQCPTGSSPGGDCAGLHCAQDLAATASPDPGQCCPDGQPPADGWMCDDGSSPVPCGSSPAPSRGDSPLVACDDAWDSTCLSDLAIQQASPSPSSSPTTAFGGQCTVEDECPDGQVCSGYDPGWNSPYPTMGVCLPEECDDDGQQAGFQFFRLLANEIFIGAMPVHAQGARRSQPCYRALLDRLVQGDLKCSPDQAAECASQAGKGCFLDPNNTNKHVCFDMSNLTNPCVGPNATTCSGEGMVCSACYGGCVRLSDFCDKTACEASGGTCNAITLSCVPNGANGAPISNEQICNNAGLSLVNGQCVQDRCRGTRCPNNGTCNKDTGLCDNGTAGSEVIYDACLRYDINCPAGQVCRNLPTSTGDTSPTCVAAAGQPAETKTTCDGVTCPTGMTCADPSPTDNVPVACVPNACNSTTCPANKGVYCDNNNVCRPDPCSKDHPENRVCPPTTICQRVGGFAECKMPVNQVCDSTNATADNLNDCVAGAVCRTVNGVGQCLPTVNDQNGKCTSTAQCPVGTGCVTDPGPNQGKCIPNRNECGGPGKSQAQADNDCKAAGMGLKTCQNNRCAFPANLDPCYLTEMLNESQRYGLFAGEVIEAALFLKDKTCNRGSSNTASGATLNTLGLPYGTVSNGTYRPPNLSGTGASALLTGSISYSAYQRYSASGSTVASSPSHLCPVQNCSAVGELSFKPTADAPDSACRCRKPTLGDLTDGLDSPTGLYFCGSGAPMTGTGGMGTVNARTEMVARVRAEMGLPCIASEYVFENGVPRRALGTYAFCGNETTDVTGCATLVTGNGHGYPEVKVTPNCTPANPPKKCKPNMDEINKWASTSGEDCPAQPTFGAGAGGFQLPGSYKEDNQRFEATLAIGGVCSVKVDARCPGGGQTKKIRLSDYERPQNFSKDVGTFGTNFAYEVNDKGEPVGSEKYALSVGGLIPINQYCGGSGGSDGGGSGGTPITDSSRLPLCPDVAKSSSLTQCKYPIHPWYSITSRTYPSVTTDRLYAVFGGRTFLPVSCWRVEEYSPSASANDPWAANLIQDAPVSQPSSSWLSRWWNRILQWIGWGSDAPIASMVRLPSGALISTAVIPQECLDTTKIGIGQKARTGTAAGTGVGNRLPQCRALLGLDPYPGGALSNRQSTTTFGDTPIPAVYPPVILNRRFYAVPTCSGAGYSPLHPEFSGPSPSASPLPSASASPSPTSSVDCGPTCPSGQCKRIEGYGPFCVATHTCSIAPSPCTAGRHMCVIDGGQWSCTDAASRPAGATCVVCDGSTPLPTATSSASPRPSTSPSASVSPSPSSTTTGRVSSFSISVPNSLVVGVPVDMTVCAKNANGATVAGYRGTITTFIAEDTPPSSFPNLPRYTFSAADNGCHTFRNGLTLQFPGESTIVAVDVEDPMSVYGTLTVNGRAPGAPSPSASPSPSVGPSPSTSPSPTSSAAAACPRDLKACPDGSYVGRARPTCDFAACPNPSGNSNSAPCTQEARLCPDGSTVGRVKPSCDFAACSQRMLGDVNGDNRITIADLSLVIDSLTGLRGVVLSNEQAERADVTCDRRINLADVAKIANFIVQGGDTAGRSLTCGTI